MQPSCYCYRPPYQHKVLDSYDLIMPQASEGSGCNWCSRDLKMRQSWLAGGNILGLGKESKLSETPEITHESFTIQ